MKSIDELRQEGKALLNPTGRKYSQARARRNAATLEVIHALRTEFESRNAWDAIRELDSVLVRITRAQDTMWKQRTQQLTGAR